MFKLPTTVLAQWLAGFFLLCLHMAGASAATPTTLENASLNLQFNLADGSIRHWRLPQLRDATGQEQDMAAPEGRLFALTGKLAGKDLREWETLAGGWKIREQSPDTLVMVLEQADQPFTLTRRWHLREQSWRADFAVELHYQTAASNADDQLELQVGPGIGELPAQGLGMGQSIYSYTELVYRDNDGVQTLRLGGADNQQFSADQAAQTTWLGLQSRYLAMILSAANDNTLHANWQASVPRLPEAEAELAPFRTSVSIRLPIHATTSAQEFQWHVFGGGKAYQALTSTEPDLGGLLFSSLWNWMRGLSLGIMQVLESIQHFIGNWGLSIILLAFLIRLVMYPMAKKTISAQKKFAAIQARIQPELQEIRRNYKGGEQSERILQLYEHHQVSPLAGLKPLLIVLVQVPVFVALFHLLGQTFELRDASFLWIKTLAEPDQLFPLGTDLPVFGAYFNLLPVLMAFTTLLSIKLASVPDGQSAARQALSSGLMGLGFFVLFYSFPSGMVLYWTVANILQVAHQKIAKG
ncbi:MAG TPA: membrane protein insertase YidC [Pseudomonas sp.]